MASILLIVNGISCFTALDDEFIRCCQQIVVVEDSSAILANFIDIPVQLVSSISEFIEILPTVQADFIAYLLSATSSLTLPDTTIVQNYLAPLLPEVTLPQETAIEMSMASGWIASTEIAKFALPRLKSWTILEIAQVLEIAGVAFLWGGVATRNITQGESESPLIPRHMLQAGIPDGRNGSPTLGDFKCPVPPELGVRGQIYPTQQRRKNNIQVLAIITHYRCEAWLNRCLESLVNQTRAPDKIVVIDDGSENPPISIVKQFPQVTLLASSVNVGTYRLIQQVISDTNYDAYLFQDADDWSSCDRLERLLQTLTLTGAELVGTQELRVYENGQINPVCYPLDVNAALKEKPGHPLIHPSSLVKRDLVMQLGGFATGLRFGGDTEFLLRASIVAKVVNIPYYCYYRRKRQGSLTTAADTGLNSPARQELIKVLKSRALANYAALRAKRSPCLTPLITASPIKLKYITGSFL